MLKLEKRITLHTFDVEYIDQREAKPRTVRRETVVLDGGRVSCAHFASGLYTNPAPRWIRFAPFASN